MSRRVDPPPKQAPTTVLCQRGETAWESPRVRQPAGVCGGIRVWSGMSTSPVLPLMADGTLPPVPLLLRWLARLAEQRIRSVRLEHLPPGNGSLPDLLASAGIEVLALMHSPFKQPFHWQGWSGGRVLVADSASGSATGSVTMLHHGELPWSATTGTIDPALTSAITEARVDDVAAVRDLGPGAAWRRLLDQLDGSRSGHNETEPPAATRAPALLGVCNPLAVARRMLVALPASEDAAPVGLRDQRGARHAVQVVDGAHGRELLTSVQLGALEAVTLESFDHAVAGSHWEVSSTVIDNGRVRAELDHLGQIVRLCCDGRFVAWSGPALQATIAGLPMGGAATISVLETGPVRARIGVTRQCDGGSLQLLYTVHAHEPVLRVAATWDGPAGLRLDCPTPVHAAPLEIGGELSGWSVPQHARGDLETLRPIAGLRWARLSGSDRHGLAVSGQPTMTVSAHAGCLSLHLANCASFALCESAWPVQDLGIAAWSLSLSTPGHLTTHANPALLRLAGDGVVPWWSARPDGWRGEILLGQPHGLRGRCTLYLSAHEAVRCHLDGNATPLRRTADGDGFEVDLAAGGITTVRWR